MILSDAAIKNRTTVGVLMVLIVVIGVLSYATLPREAAPDVETPFVFVTTTYEGVSPEDVETSVTMKLESELGALKGVKEMRSFSAEGLSKIMIEFQPDVKIDEAMQLVRDKVDLAKADLPADAEDPAMSELNVGEMPIMGVSVSGPISIVRIKDIAERLSDAIEQNVQGVLNVDVSGGREREIRLAVDPDKISAYGLTVTELLTLIPSENVNISAGSLETPGMKFNVRIPAEFVEPEEVDHLLLTVRDGRPIYLTDVATVLDTFKDRVGYSRIDGVESVNLSIRKRIGANLLTLADGVQAILTEARRRAPEGVRFVVTTDISKVTRLMVHDLENNILSGLVLVLLVLIVFLGFRTSLIVALAIPMSMLITFAVIQVMDLTLNMIVLFGLIMALGMLVDNAIVIVENIYRFRQLGHDRVDAAMKGAAQVAWPVITSTATTIAAFAPMLFWPGLMGDFMKYLPLTLIVTLASSLLVAMVISPTVCSLVAGGSHKRRSEGAFIRGYRRVLALALDYRGVTISLAGLLMAAMCILYGKFNRGVELFPEMDPPNGFVNLRFPQGTNIRRTDAMAREIERRVGAYREHLQYMVTNVGSLAKESFGMSSGGPHLAGITLTFLDFKDRKRTSLEILEDIREDLTDIAGAEITVEYAKEGPPTGAPIEIQVVGEDFDTLIEISERIKKMVATVPGAINIRSDFEAARPELAFHVDRRRAMLMGVNTAVIGNFLKTAIFGYKVGIYRQFNDEYDITVRLPQDARENIEDMLRLCVPNGAGVAVPLSSLGAFEYVAGLGTIRHLDQKRLITVGADNAKGVQGQKVLGIVQEWLSDEGRSMLIAADVLDWGRFCKWLVGDQSLQRSALASAVFKRLDKECRNIAKHRAGGGEIDAKGREKLLLRVSRILKDEKLLKDVDMAGLAITNEARDYLRREHEDLSKAEIARMNRLVLESALSGAIAHAERLDMPAEYNIRYAGEKEEQDRAQAFLSKAFVIALLLIVMILVT
ncbi:MAG: efflux RND transporter permease subunit, partial [Planctomycetes bacterium]|nr:efflux RND transporter permease subunit [Planctomycetota bacterium]